MRLALVEDEDDRCFLLTTGRFFLLRFAFSRSAAANCATLKACWARACACTCARNRTLRSSSSAAARIIWICSSVVRSSAPDGRQIGSEAADSSSMALSEGGVIGRSVGKRSSSERYELAVDSSDSALSRDGLLGQEGKAQAELIPMAPEKDDLRGVISRSPSLGDGGGGGGGSDDGEGEEDVLPLKL